MEKTRKKRIKRCLFWGCFAAAAVILAAMPLLAAKNAEEDGPVSVVKSGIAETGSITEVLRGGGTLSEETPQDITIPAGVKLTKFLVENGDSVSAGEALAAVDKVSAMTAITQVQETLDYLDDKLESANGSTSSSVKAQTAGRVKILYAQPGDSVQNVMLEHGALAVLSLDGRMAVDIVSDGLKVGDSVLVALASGEEITGRVESTLGENAVITISDDGYAVDTSARVCSADGTYLGYGKLYVFNAWNVTAWYGTVSTVPVKENATVYPGQTLFTLNSTDNSAEFTILLRQRQEYEALISKLFTMYQSGVISAPCDGIVSGVDTDSEFLLSAGDQECRIQLLANAPPDNNDGSYTNTLVWIQSINEDGTWNVKTAEGPSVEDYLDFSVFCNTASMTDTDPMSPVTVYTKTTETEEDGTETTYWASGSGVQVGDILLVADGGFAIRVGYAAIPAAPSEGGDATPPADEEQTAPAQPSEEGETPVQPEGGQEGLPGEMPEMPSGAMGAEMGGMTGGYSGSTVQQPVFEAFDLKENTILTVTPSNTMTLDISVDELDISKVAVGQSAKITVTALGGDGITGVVSKIGQAENSGGSSKFSVTITLPREENMLSGMTAQAALTLGTVDNAVTVPAAALDGSGCETFIYTTQNEKSGEPDGAVTVTTGVSDGETVQILTGLEPGDSYYYRYYDAQEIK